MNLSTLRSWWPIVAVAVVLVAAVVAAAHSAPQLDRVPRGSYAAPTSRPDTRTVPPREAPPDIPAGDVDLPAWVVIMINAALLVLVAAVAIIVITSLVSMLGRRRRAGADGAGAAEARSEAEPGEEVIAALDAGLDDLSDADRDPRRAVIACWLRLEQAAEAAGVPRRVGDTSTDLVARLLGRVASADVLASFAEVYREARYATHTVDERMREQARAALRRLRTELTAAAASSPAAGSAAAAGPEPEVRR